MGNIEEYHLGKMHFSLEVPKDWKLSRNQFGLPFVLKGPQTKHGRPVIAVNKLYEGQTIFQHERLEDISSYKEERQAWLKETGGTELTYLPYRFRKLSEDVSIHQLGYRFQLGGVDFAEKTYYIQCPGQVYHLKSLYPLLEMQKAEYNSERMVKSFKCYQG